LALLLSTPGYSLSAEAVAEAMCPEKDPCAAVDFYHHAISALRRLLEPDIPNRRFSCRYLEVSEERVTLVVPPASTIDFLDFEQHVQHKDWEKAIDIYHGEYLPMYSYSEWTIALREHYSDLYEQALLAQAMVALQKGNPATCLDISRRALLQNPWQEQAVEMGMRAAMELGDRVTAIKLYQRLGKKLEKELGIAPQNELQELYKVVLKRSRDP
jgi:DNA-binding SARP family transcriptional activator